MDVPMELRPFFCNRLTIGPRTFRLCVCGHRGKSSSASTSWFTMLLSKLTSNPLRLRASSSRVVMVSPGGAVSLSHYRYFTTLPAKKSEENFSPAYVHHVSKTVLEHLQARRSKWLEETGLDRGLRLNANGTFVLQFPSRKGFDAGRIWTSYDIGTKQHWLSVYRRRLKSRYLLKDSSKPNDAETVGAKIAGTIDQMIGVLQRNEQKC